ncbi:alpha/beta-hydrolase [Schizopora paradoxa]|uniref:Alpha/beta-hydrolase n=1 Tax=Schizopora paradoxa TaxID=27342 RepID=A0A0H2RBB3_9AGAM|nr:alpha/beta-hydrolase [Schizopora paradoxa]
MNKIATLQGADIPVVLGPTYEAFVPLLEANKDRIKGIQCETHGYGDTDRHMLDIYYPPKADGASKHPVLIFVYGGGFASGERTSPPGTNTDLVYANVGAFFAARGFVTVIPDYRILPAAKHPLPDEDVRDALKFVVTQLTDKADTNSIFLHGHSVGGSIVASLFLSDPGLLETELKGHVKGLILMASLYHYDGPIMLPPELIAAYYGESHAKDCPYGLLQTASKEVVTALPSLYIMRSENEPELVKVGQIDFVKLLKEKAPGVSVQEAIASGHNHISPHVALSSGEGEQWGEDILSWVRAHVS